MQIGPIAEIRVLPAVKAPPVDPQLSALFDIEGTAKPDDDSYSGGAKKAAGAEEEEADEVAGEEGNPIQSRPATAPSAASATSRDKQLLAFSC